MNWDRFEMFLGEQIPRCVKVALDMCGYSTILSLCEIKQKNIDCIEKHINENRNEQMQKMQCNHSHYYNNIQQFHFLPGHEAIILALPKYALEFQQILKNKAVDIERNVQFPFVLNEMIKTVEMNQFKDVNHATYSDTIRFFATYIFLLCGRSCYEMIRTNLPLPSTKTIREKPSLFCVTLYCQM